MFNIGPQELLVILLVALVIVGPKRLPELSRTIGRGLREFRKAQDEVRRTINLSLDEPPEPASPRPTTSDATVSGDQAVGEMSSDGAAAATARTDDTGSGGTTAASESNVDAAQVARTLGRGLAELRRAREEIQRTFRVDLSDHAGTVPARRAPRTSDEPTTGPANGDRPGTSAPTSGVDEAGPPAPDAEVAPEPSSRAATSDDPASEG
jgi:TatA/E family protein of Tat protein translocase